MFINARNALTAAGATRRQMPFRCYIEHPVAPGSTVWTSGPSGNSVDYLAESYNDAKVLWGHARIVAESGDVIFYG